MLIEINQLTNLIQTAAKLGVSEYIAETNNKQDRLTQRQAVQFLKLLGYNSSKLTELVDSNKIKGKRYGAGQNSPVYYSKHELMILTSAEKVQRLIY